MVGEVFAGGAVLFDGAGGGDVVGGDRVAEDGEGTGGADVFDRGGGCGHAVEVRSLADVGGVGLPAVGVAGGELEVLPVLVAVGDGGVLVAEHVGVDAGGDGVGDFLLRGPDVLEVDGRAGLVLAEGVGVEVVADVAGERVGDDQRRRHEVIGADFGGDAAFEVAIAGEDGDGDERVVFDGFGDVGGQRAGVADTGGAAVADGVEAELVEILGEAGLVVVVGDDAGAGGEGGLDPGRRLRGPSRRLSWRAGRRRP